MRTISKTTICLLLALAVMATSTLAGKHREKSWTFDKKESIRIKTISGDCIVKKSKTDRIEVEVISSYSPRNSFEPKARATGRAVRLSEKMYGSNSGSSTWYLSVPEGTEIEFSSASGDLIIADMKGDFSAETASGDVQIENCSGEFEFSTASGDIEMIDCQGVFEMSTASGEIEMTTCRGEFDLGTASGDIDAVDIILEFASSFSTASGSVEVTLAETAEFDLEVSTASGRATLDYGGNPIKGSFEFVSKDRRGRIRCPFDFEDERRFDRWGDTYVRKTFTRDGDEPHIIIETASGRATLSEG
ncbi:MAG: DUF4097 domain-containing protein [candidate division Zixibacteria bacterium]|nr:DUF4097 domain-containing protein [candidate division Zixibacteria bacterium]